MANDELGIRNYEWREAESVHFFSLRKFVQSACEKMGRRDSDS